MDKIVHGSCQEVLADIPDNTFDLIVTSPPYADARKNDYGGVAPDSYNEWMLPKTKEFLRVLKPTGTFILNMKEKVHKGERHTYVLELILNMREQGWLWTEEFIWSKKNCMPGKWPNRFRDAWERLLQFNKQKKFNMYQDEVREPIGDWTKTRLANLSEKDKQRQESAVNSGFGKNQSYWADKDTVYPSNVLSMATECGNKKHSAAFPESLPEWFIKLFTKKGDYVLDPFSGSGTVGVSAKRLGRNYFLIDILESNCKIAEERINECVPDKGIL